MEQSRFKFRAWNTIDKVMITDLNSPSFLHGVLVHDCDDILMQNTGLKDKNGKEIYEGDIIQWGESNIETVFFNELHAGFETEQSMLCNQTMEVIGNIHENPELLKGE